MSTTSENPTAPCPPTAIGAWPPNLAPVEPLAAEEGPGAETPRRAKSALLPEIARLALAGHSGRVIGKRLGVPGRTVARWLQELRQQWAASAAEEAAQFVPVTLARLELAYREAMDAWLRSLADTEVTTETPGDDSGTPPRTCVRRATQSGQAAMLGKVIHAAKEIQAFKEKHLAARRQAEAAESNRVCRSLTEELWSLDKSKFAKTKCILQKTSGPAAARDPHELAEAINRLSAEEYRKLRFLLWDDYDLGVPFRRAIPGPADSVTVDAAAEPCGPIAAECGNSHD
jgi:hypothetical protein